MTVESLTLTMNGETSSLPFALTDDYLFTDNGVSYYGVRVDGIAAKDIETEYTLLLTLSYNGLALTDSYTDSVAAALTQAAADNAGTAFADAANATLAYCKAAADAFGKANTIACSAVPNTVAYTPMQNHSEGSGEIRICGTSLILKDELAIRFWAEIGEFVGTVNDLVVLINGRPVEPVRNDDGDYFTFKIPVPVNMAKEAITIELQKDGVTVSNRYTDSVVDYALSSTGDYAAVGQAILNYVYYANVYLDPTTATGYVPSGEELPPVDRDPQ